MSLLFTWSAEVKQTLLKKNNQTTMNHSKKYEGNYRNKNVKTNKF